MLYLIGLGLGDAKDITIRGLEIVKSVGKVYLENFTSMLCCDHKELEQFYGRPVVIVDREMMETGHKEILEAAAAEEGAAVLVIGDPLNATTHTALLTIASGRGIPFQIVHNASIINAVACCGLQIYSFGETVSIPFWTDTWKPESFFDKILSNKQRGLHTLCLLDIRVKETDYNLLIKGIKQYEPARFMSVSQAAEQLVSIVKRRKKEEAGVEVSANTTLQETSTCIGLARVGSQTQQIVKTTLAQATKVDLGSPLHSLVIPGDLQPVELEMIDFFSQSPVQENRN